MRTKRWGTFLTILVVTCPFGSRGLAQRPSVRLTVKGVVTEGTPAAWSDHNLLLLGRDGFLLNIASRDVQQYAAVSTAFRPMDQREMRGRLQREFGRAFDVSGTGTYLVVHPAGERDTWAPRFEQLYRSFTHHFGVRGTRIARPEFPLVAVAFKSRAEFVRYASQTGVQVPPGVVGFYSMLTNRIMLYDAGGKQSTSSKLTRNAATILHEATHQIAFNSGIHSRYAAPPRWLAEGLAMMFEAPGVWDPGHYPRLEDRINPDLLLAFVRYLKTGRQMHQLTHFIGQSDERFASDPATAYAEAWAFSFFLSEKEPTRYGQYLAVTAAREPFRKYSEAERLQEFTRVFGVDLDLLEARFLRFIEQLSRS